MNLGNTLTAFTMVFPAELPDKSMFATLVLTSRFRRPFAVWCGVAAAFSLHVVVAVTAGSLIHRLPERLVGGVAALLFAVGAVLLWRESKEPGDESSLTDGESDPGAQQVSTLHPGGPHLRLASSPTSESITNWQAGSGTPASVATTSTRLRTVLVTSFVTVGLAEWGDLTQLATASLAADRGDPFGVGIGAYVALLTVAAFAAFTGRWIVRVVPLQTVRRFAAALFAGLAMWTLFELQ